MQTAPSKESMMHWLTDFQSVHADLFDKGKIILSDIDSKQWSGHFNFLVSINNQRFILRFKGPEWGKTNGIKNEYTTLKRVEKYKVGPKVFHLIDDFFGEPAMLMEYLEGHLFNPFDSIIQQHAFQNVAICVANINSIPFQREDFPFQEPMMSYERNKKTWHERVREIQQVEELRSIGREIMSIIPHFEKRLDVFEPLLREVISKHGPVFIFESAHAGHLFETKDGLRFINWEQVSFGDPSFVLAVFLMSIKSSADFEDIKKEMTKTYLKKMSIEKFEHLLDQRLWERSVSNAIYRIWSVARQQNKHIDISALEQQIQEIKKLAIIM